MMWPFSMWFKPKPKFKRWPTKTVTYCFRDVPFYDRSVLPMSYRFLVNECAREWTEKTDINLVLRDFRTIPQPDIVISLKELPKKTLGFGYFPGESSLCGDIDLDDRDWWKNHSRDYFKTIILHELGHALGLEHSVCKRSIMYKYPRAKSIHSFDVKNLNKGYEG